jgi:hypothetical protein
MSTEQTQESSPESTHKVLNLYGQQVTAYQNARLAVMKHVGAGLTEGEIVKELAAAYTGHDGPSNDPPICGLVSETAAENGDRTYLRDELEQKDITTLRNMAAEANTNAISGRSTKLEIIAYFSCPGSTE